MLWALITDLHANRQALEAVLADARDKGATRFALLGDFVGYGADPAWVVEQSRQLQDAGAVVVKGNHDAAVAAGSHPGMHADARAVIDWTRAQLGSEDLKWLADLPLTDQRGEILFVHANAFDPPGWEYVQSRADAVRSLHASAARLSFCGHMHEPMLFHVSGTGKAGEFRPQAGVRIPLPSNRQWLGIPGSCGQPRDGNPAACYALFKLGDTAADESHISFERVPYDIESAVAALQSSALPAALSSRLAQRLQRGE